VTSPSNSLSPLGTGGETLMTDDELEVEVLDETDVLVAPGNVQ
jgi:hypothetical protein